MSPLPWFFFSSSSTPNFPHYFIYLFKAALFLDPLQTPKTLPKNLERVTAAAAEEEPPSERQRGMPMVEELARKLAEEEPPSERRRGMPMVEELARKLALWHTPTFRPIITHDDLEPILVSLGFVPVPMSELPAPPEEEPMTTWREYAFRRTLAPPGSPRPRLPWPRVDGLHVLTYKAFFVALAVYLGPHQVPNLFHVRTMPLSRTHDRVFDRVYRQMKECECDGIVFVYREGTLDHITQMICSLSSDEDTVDDGDGIIKVTDNSGNKCQKMNCGNDNTINSANLTCLVPLKDLLPNRGIVCASLA